MTNNLFANESGSMPCGESGCFCHGTSSEHADCACGCDCPRCWDCLQKADNCEC